MVIMSLGSKEEKNKELPVFQCSLCKLTAPYCYYGARPRGVRKLTYENLISDTY